MINQKLIFNNVVLSYQNITRTLYCHKVWC